MFRIFSLLLALLFLISCRAQTGEQISRAELSKEYRGIEEKILELRGSGTLATRFQLSRPFLTSTGVIIDLDRQLESIKTTTEFCAGIRRTEAFIPKWDGKSGERDWQLFKVQATNEDDCILSASLDPEVQMNEIRASNETEGYSTDGDYYFRLRSKENGELVELTAYRQLRRGSLTCWFAKFGVSGGPKLDCRILKFSYSFPLDIAARY
ncbi:hypothetical protein [uncultured Shimia sp.]|uniref:hypothetical protein n=1 Tax=uncultured Shimia sp. TaxID=573152 RepID=UPI0026321330|nr:hypothetical protein [uncultured Shimia sp.]